MPDAAVIHRCFSLSSRATLLGCAAAIVAACGGGSVEPLKTPVTYQLVSIDRLPLPITDSTIHSGIITAGKLTLVGSDSAVSNQTDFEPSVNANPPLTLIEVGIYSVRRNGSMLILDPIDDSPVDTAFVSGDSITLNRHVPFAGVTRIRVYEYVTQ